MKFSYCRFITVSGLQAYEVVHIKFRICIRIYTYSTYGEIFDCKVTIVRLDSVFVVHIGLMQVVSLCGSELYIQNSITSCNQVYSYVGNFLLQILLLNFFLSAINIITNQWYKADSCIFL